MLLIRRLNDGSRPVAVECIHPARLLGKTWRLGRIYDDGVRYVPSLPEFSLNFSLLQSTNRLALGFHILALTAMFIRWML